MKNAKVLLTVIGACFTLSACGGVGKAAQGVAQTSLDNLGCKAAQSEMWNSLNKITEDGDAYPSEDEIRQALLNMGALRGQVSPAYERYVDAFVANYKVTIGGIKEKFAPYSDAAWRKALAEMEVGVKVTDVHEELSNKIESSMQKLKVAEKELGATCPQPELPAAPPEIPEVAVNHPAAPGSTPATPPMPQVPSENAENFATVWDQLKAKEKIEVYGSRLVLATAYQSCSVLKVAPMNAATPLVEGISKDPKPNPINGGILRHYASLPKINSTHHYIAGQTLAKNSCYDVKQNPPIYDFGGKPFATSSKPLILDMFRGDGGSGSEVFGIDCSGYVFSSLGVAGLRMITPDPDKPLKASLVGGIPAAAFKDPTHNGLKCMELVKPTKTRTVQPGDVVAIRGHVVMIDSVGADPFGLNKITKLENCNANYIVPDNFNFVISQSSPSKGGTGINKYVARDYMKNESGTYRDGFISYAIASCRDKFGAAPNLSSPDLSIVTHKLTAECRATALQLNKQECVDSCMPL